MKRAFARMDDCVADVLDSTDDQHSRLRKKINEFSERVSKLDQNIDYLVESKRSIGAYLNTALLSRLTLMRVYLRHQFVPNSLESGDKAHYLVLIDGRFLDSAMQSAFKFTSAFDSIRVYIDKGKYVTNPLVGEWSRQDYPAGTQADCFRVKVYNNERPCLLRIELTPTRSAARRTVEISRDLERLVMPFIHSSRQQRDHALTESEVLLAAWFYLSLNGLFGGGGDIIVKDKRTIKCDENLEHLLGCESFPVHRLRDLLVQNGHMVFLSSSFSSFSSQGIADSSSGSTATTTTTTTTAAVNQQRDEEKLVLSFTFNRGGDKTIDTTANSTAAGGGRAATAFPSDASSLGPAAGVGEDGASNVGSAVIYTAGQNAFSAAGSANGGSGGGGGRGGEDVQVLPAEKVDIMGKYGPNPAVFDTEGGKKGDEAGTTTEKDGNDVLVTDFPGKGKTIVVMHHLNPYNLMDITTKYPDGTAFNPSMFARTHGGGRTFEIEVEVPDIFAPKIATELEQLNDVLPGIADRNAERETRMSFLLGQMQRVRQEDDLLKGLFAHFHDVLPTGAGGGARADVRDDPLPGAKSGVKSTPIEPKFGRIGSRGAATLNLLTASPPDLFELISQRPMPEHMRKRKQKYSLKPSIAELAARAAARERGSMNDDNVLPNMRGGSDRAFLLSLSASGAASNVVEQQRLAEGVTASDVESEDNMREEEEEEEEGEDGNKAVKEGAGDKDEDEDEDDQEEDEKEKEKLRAKEVREERDRMVAQQQQQQQQLGNSQSGSSAAEAKLTEGEGEGEGEEAHASLLYEGVSYQKRMSSISIAQSKQGSVFNAAAKPTSTTAATTLASSVPFGDASMSGTGAGVGTAEKATTTTTTATVQDKFVSKVPYKLGAVHDLSGFLDVGNDSIFAPGSKTLLAVKTSSSGPSGGNNSSSSSSGGGNSGGSSGNAPLNYVENAPVEIARGAWFTRSVEALLRTPPTRALEPPAAASSSLPSSSSSATADTAATATGASSAAPVEERERE